MKAIKTRINITLSNSAREHLSRLARRDRVPQATKATRLLEIALELDEDQVWETLAEKRDVKNARYLSHDQVWQ